MGLFDSVSLLGRVVLKILLPSLDAFGKSDGLSGIGSTNLIAEDATCIYLKGQEFVSGGDIGSGLRQFFIEFLSAKVLVSFAVTVGQGSHVEEIVGLQGVVIGGERTAIDTGLYSLGVVSSVFRELIRCFSLRLILGLHYSKRRATVFCIGFGTIRSRHLGDAPLSFTVGSSGK